MASQRGDSSRFHRLRKQKMRKREKMRELRAMMIADLKAEQTATAAPVVVAQPVEA
jgi:hypothetical protein